MNREIKFRAWDGNSMWYPFEENDLMVLLGDSGYFEVQDHGRGVTAVDVFNSSDNSKAVLMQYTGLKDKNGEEIYEGDLLKDVFESGIRQEVVFEDCRFLVRGSGVLLSNYASKESIEVIGNIYETH